MYNYPLSDDIVRNLEIIESANSIILRMDTSGSVNYLNRFALEFFGYNLDEIIGKNVIGTIVPEYESFGGDLRTMIDNITKNPSKYTNNQNENIKKDGERVWISWTNKGVFGKDGALKEILCIGNDITHTKRIERALRESEQQFRTSFEFGTIGIAITSPDKGLIRVNDEMCRMLGYTREELSKMTWAKITHPEDVEPAVSHFNSVLAGEVDGYSVDIRFIRKDGTVVYTTLWLNCKRGDGGKVDYCIAMLQDITERKKLEERLRLQGEIITSMEEGVVLIKADDGTIVYANPNFNRMFGYEDVELTGRNISVINAPTDVSPKEATEQIISAIKETGSGQGEVLNIKKDGTRFWCHVTVFTFKHNTYGTVWVSIHQDITQRKNAEKKVWETGERLRVIIDNSSDRIFIKDIEGKYLLINSQFEKLHHVTRTEILGKTDYDLFPKEVADEARKNDNAVLINLRSMQFIENVPEDGVMHVYLSIRFPLFDASAQDYGVCGITTDITELKKNEEIIRMELALKSSIARVIEALLNPELDKFDISKLVYEEALMLTGSKLGFASAIEKDTGRSAYGNLTDILETECRISKDKPMRFPKGPEGGAYGYNALWGHSLNTKIAPSSASSTASPEGFYTNNPSGHPAFKNCKPEALPSGHIPIKRFLSVPVVLGDRLIGQIALANPIRDYNDRDLESIARLASIFAIALERKKMEKAIRIEIASRHAAEVLLKERELDLIETQYKAHFGTWTYNPVTQKSEWSIEMFNIWGLDPKAGPPHYNELIKHIHPDDYQSFDDAVREAVEHGKPYRLEMRIYRPDNTERIITTTCEPILDATGKIEELRGSNHDITDMKILQSTLAKELEFKSVVDDISEALLSPNVDIVDIAGIVHRQALKLTKSPFGYVSEIDRKTGEEVGHTHSAMKRDGQCDVDPKQMGLALPKGPDGYNALWGHALNTRQAFYTNAPETHPAYKRCIPPGHFHLMCHLAVPVLGGGELIGQIAVANAQNGYTDNDLNIIKRMASIYSLAVQRKRMEEDLRELNRTLEQRVKEETNKIMIQEQMLIQQSKLVAMGEMISAIAHQWRQPLTATSFMIQDLKEAYDYNELTGKYLNENINKAMAQLEFMSKTIDDFRNFFQPAKEKIPFNVNDKIKSALALLSAQLSDLLIEIIFKSSIADNLTITGYPNEFIQVFVIIINNARDAILAKRSRGLYTDGNGMVSIDIRDIGKSVQIDINDDGGDIPEKIMDKIFEPYFTTKFPASGTGIGLYMSKVIIENHMGGRLYAENTGDGVTFTIELMK